MAIKENVLPLAQDSGSGYIRTVSSGGESQRTAFDTVKGAITADMDEAIADEADAREAADDQLQTEVDGKVDKVTGKGLSTNDFTNALKTKLDGIEAGAELNVQSDWNQTNTGADDYIKNKPGNATTSAAGFMSAADKTKLDGIEAGAEVNIIETVKVNGTALVPDANRAVNVPAPTVDSALSTTSENPVQNKVITGAVNDLKEDLDNNIENTIKVYGGKESAYSYNISIEAGALDDNGQPVSRPNRFRTSEFIFTNGKYLVLDNIPSTVAIYVFQYDENKNYITSNTAGYRTKRILSDLGAYIKIQFSPYPTSETITEELCETVTLKTSNVYVEDKNRLNVKMEGGRLSSGYTSTTASDYRTYRRTAFFIDVKNATHLAIEGLTSGTATICSYDSNGVYLGYKDIALATVKIAELENGCAFAKFYLTNVPNSATINNLNVYLINGIDAPIEVKNFRVARTDPYEFLTFKLDDESCGTARLMLPPNYSNTGEKTPLILWLDGSGNFASWTGGFTTSKLPYIEYMRDEGFAIASIFGWSSSMYSRYPRCGNAHPYPSPTGLKCLNVGLKYIFDRYNIDPTEIHIMSKSHGGQTSLYLASHPLKGLKSIGMFSPVLDFLSMRGEASYDDTRKALAEDVGFTGNVNYFTSTNYLVYSAESRAFFAENIDIMCGLNEAWTDLVGGVASTRLTEAINDSETFWTESLWQHPERTDIYTHGDRAKIAAIPVKIWGASDDANTPYLKMVEVVNQLKNGGCEAVMETLPRGTGDHSCADAGSNIVSSITTALGITHTNIPVGWVENIEWIRLHMAK